MEGKANDRIAGAALVLAAAGSVLMMAHHPSGVDTNGFNAFVHGAMIALIAIMGYGLIHMSRRIGLDRPLVLAGVVAYAVGMFAGIGAATINGFVVPALAAHGPVDRGVALLAWESNQALARLGVVASAVAFLLWSIGFVRQQGWPAKTLGAIGLAAALAPIVLLGSGSLRMNLTGAIIIYGVHALWVALAGLYLWSGRFTADRALNASDGM